MLLDEEEEIIEFTNNMGCHIRVLAQDYLPNMDKFRKRDDDDIEPVIDLSPNGGPVSINKQILLKAHIQSKN
jgi:hypothetical protein